MVGAHSPVLPGTPGTHGGAGYSADAAALWPPVGALGCGRPWGWAGLPRTPTTPNRQAHPAMSRPSCRTRSGTHTRTRLPRLRSGTLSATARLDVRTFTPRSHHHGYRVSPVRRRKATSCRTRSGTHTCTRLPRLRSGTPLATGRLNVMTYPRTPTPRAPTRDAPTRSQPRLGRGQRASPHSHSPVGEGWGEGQSTTPLSSYRGHPVPAVGRSYSSCRT